MAMSLLQSESNNVPSFKGIIKIRVKYFVAICSKVSSRLKIPGVF